MLKIWSMIYLCTPTASLSNIVLDFYDSKSKVIHEIKKSDKMEEIHVWQVKHYILVLENKGVLGVTGVIDYPKLRQ